LPPPRNSAILSSTLPVTMTLSLRAAALGDIN
jgi:hypothetical protein